MRSGGRAGGDPRAADQRDGCRNERQRRRKRDEADDGADAEGDDRGVFALAADGSFFAPRNDMRAEGGVGEQAALDAGISLGEQPRRQNDERHRGQNGQDCAENGEHEGGIAKAGIKAAHRPTLAEPLARPKGNRGVEARMMRRLWGAASSALPGRRAHSAMRPPKAVMLCNGNVALAGSSSKVTRSCGAVKISINIQGCSIP